VDRHKITGRRLGFIRVVEAQPQPTAFNVTADEPISEFICSATETAEYNRLVGKPVAPAADSTNK
jgi:hypothetical protein